MNLAEVIGEQVVEKATETRGKAACTLRNMVRRDARIQVHLGQIGGIVIQIIQSGGHRRAERGSLIAMSVSGREEEATTSTANL